MMPHDRKCPDYPAVGYGDGAACQQCKRTPCVCAIDADVLAADVVRMCKHRGWSMHWTHRGAYLHLEASELIEAIRGKHGDPKAEAGDVLLVLMSITEYLGIPWADVERAARAKCDEMLVRPRYAGEEHDGLPLGAEPVEGAPGCFTMPYSQDEGSTRGVR